MGTPQTPCSSKAQLSSFSKVPLPPCLLVLALPFPSPSLEQDPGTVCLETGRLRSSQTPKLLLTTSLALPHSFQGRQLRSRRLPRLLIPKKSCGKAGTVRDTQGTAKSIPHRSLPKFHQRHKPCFSGPKLHEGRAGKEGKGWNRGEPAGERGGKPEEKPDSRSERPFPPPPCAHSSRERSRAPAGTNEPLR